MSRDNGILIAAPGKKVDRSAPNELGFDSDKHTLMVKVGQEPPHADTVSYLFQSNPALPGTIGDTSQTIIATIAHNYGYIPASFGFISVKSPSTDGLSVPADSYYRSPLFIPLTGGGTQYIHYFVDNKNLYVAYRIQNRDDLSLTYVDMTGFSFDFKYYIFANPGA